MGLAEELIAEHRADMERLHEESRDKRQALEDRAATLAACAVERLVLGTRRAGTNVVILEGAVTFAGGHAIVAVSLDNIPLEWEGTPRGDGYGYDSEEGGLRCFGVQVGDLADIAAVLSSRDAQKHAELPVDVGAWT